MRIDLELIKKIEAYLTGTMDPTEVKIFEQQIQTQTALKEAVEQQRNLMKAMEKTFVKKAAIKAGKRVRMYSFLKKGGIVVVILIVISMACWGYHQVSKNRNQSNPRQSENVVIPEMKQGEVYDPGAFITSQYFEIDGDKDTVIVGEQGTMFAIPAGSFVNGSNNPVKGKIMVELKEALDPGTILLSGLSTFSNDQPLETGGMFYLHARSNGQELKIGEGGILTSVPQTESKPGMMIFDGVVDENGNINWVNPQQPEQFLLPVDIRALDFYPPGFVGAINGVPAGTQQPSNTSMEVLGDSVSHQTVDHGHQSTETFKTDPNAKLSKHFTDSLYVSFEEGNILVNVGSDATAIDSGKDSVPVIVFQNTYNDTLVAGNRGISPSKVLAFWQSSFNQTFLATKEFESRMPLIHQTCNNAILDLYLNNLDKKLYEVDSMAANMAGGLAPEFLRFAAMKHGRIPNGDKKYDLLQKFYQRQAFVYAQAAIRTTKAFYAKNQQAELEALRRGYGFSQSETHRTNQLFNEEFELNLTKAYKDLGKERPKQSPGRIGFGKPSFNAVIFTPGWKNVDRYVAESLIARTTFDYTDTLTGRRSVIEYKEMMANVTNAGEFDMVNVYLIPDKLTMYMKVSGSNGKYTEKLNMTLKYDLFVIGYKNKQVYFQSQYGISPSSYSFTLSDNNITKVADLMAKFGSDRNTESLQMAVNYSMFKIADDERRTRYERVVADRERLIPIVFPCDATTTSIGFPNLINMELKDAVKTLNLYGYKLGKVVVKPGLPPVMKQLYKNEDIMPGAYIPSGSTIDLWVGSGISHNK